MTTTSGANALAHCDSALRSRLKPANSRCSTVTLPSACSAMAQTLILFWCMSRPMTRLSIAVMSMKPSLSNSTIIRIVLSPKGAAIQRPVEVRRLFLTCAVHGLFRSCQAIRGTSEARRVELAFAVDTIKGFCDLSPRAPAHPQFLSSSGVMTNPLHES